MPYTFFFVVMALSAVSVLVHELGHVLAAKSVGVGVKEVRVGVGPRVFSHATTRTLWTLNVFPFSGEVKLARRNVRSKPYPLAWVKLWVLSGGVLMNALLASALLTVITWQGAASLGDVYGLARELIDSGYVLLEERRPDLTATKVGLSVLSLGCIFNVLMVACNLLPLPHLDGWRMLKVARQLARRAR